MLLSPLEALLNRTLADSTTAAGLCRKLAGRVLALNVTGLNLSIFCRSDGQKLMLSTTHQGTADASISGSPLALLGLVARTPESQIRSGVVRIEGDAEAAQSFQNLLKAARPDLEEELSRLVGDVAAHQIGSLARSALSFGRRAGRTFGQNLTEYLQEESRDLPTRLEVNEFSAGVDRIRDDVERSAARLALVERNLTKGKGDRG
jgi:ubiquinone biosynthesis accessory factor UbiJ